MESIKKEARLWACVILILLLWAAVLEATRTPLSIANLEALEKLPDVVTLFLLITFAFKKWWWRWKVFKGWLVRVPDLEGTWEGELHSTWINPETAQRIPSKEWFSSSARRFRRSVALCSRRNLKAIVVQPKLMWMKLRR